MNKLRLAIIGILLVVIIGVSAETFTISAGDSTFAEDFSGNSYPSYRYTTKTFNVPEGTTKVRITHSGTDTAHIDAVLLDGRAPIGSDKLASADYDVIDALDRTVELSWINPGKTLTVTAIAEDIEGVPFVWPLGEPGTYAFGEPKTFDFFAIPYSSHPAGTVHATFSTTDSSLEVYLDVELDNTLDYGGDWAELRVQTSDGVKKFRIDSDDNTWGTSAYEYTDAVPWQHKTYRFSIPLTEFGSDTISFQIAYYGTSTAADCEAYGLIEGPTSSCESRPYCPETPSEPADPPCRLYNQDCCVSPFEPEGSGYYDTILGYAIAEDLLLDKELFVSHIIKEEAFQLQFKEIELEWQDAFITNFGGDQNVECRYLPISFAMSKRIYPYGELDKSDSLLDMLQLILSDPESRSAHGVSDEFFDIFTSAKSSAELYEYGDEVLGIPADPTKAARFKCCAYNSLKHNLVLEADGTCHPPREQPRQEHGGSGGASSCIRRIQSCCYQAETWDSDDEFCWNNNYERCEIVGPYLNGKCTQNPHPDNPHKPAEETPAPVPTVTEPKPQPSVPSVVKRQDSPAVGRAAQVPTELTQMELVGSKPIVLERSGTRNKVLLSSAIFAVILAVLLGVLSFYRKRRNPLASLERDAAGLGKLFRGGKK